MKIAATHIDHPEITDKCDDKRFEGSSVLPGQGVKLRASYLNKPQPFHLCTSGGYGTTRMHNDWNSYTWRLGAAETGLKHGF